MGTRASTANHTKQSNQKSKNPKKQFKDAGKHDEEGTSQVKEPSDERSNPNVSASGAHQELRGKIKTMEKDLDEMSQELVKVSKGYKESKHSDDTDNMDGMAKIPYIDHDTEESEGSITKETMPNDNDEVDIQIANETCSSPKKGHVISSVDINDPLSSKMAKTNNNEVEMVHQGTSNEESSDSPKSNESKAKGSRSKERRKNKHYSTIGNDAGSVSGKRSRGVFKGNVAGEVYQANVAGEVFQGNVAGGVCQENVGMGVFQGNDKGECSRETTKREFLWKRSRGSVPGKSSMGSLP
ncbi:unnamed protein product [Owenia fusiformis]|uniref:Uncharacterized protein n=1 Tax=Owenia fusiformis TaxID=6347 RepID=A0A8J1XZM9_OWEFU|nr:unnamed protein product [Owenia fusiformis]